MSTTERDQQKTDVLLGNPFRIPINALNLLEEIAKSQKADEASGVFESFGPNSRVGMLKALRESSLFPNLYAKLIRLSLITEDDIVFKQKARGRIFETLAYAYLAGQQEEGKVLTSPDDTRRFFNLMEGGATFINEEGDEAVNSIYVPDGLVVDASSSDVTIASVFEYKLHWLVDRQIAGFRYAKHKLKSIWENSEPKLTFVFPSERSGYPDVPPKEGSVLLLPINDAQFTRFADYLIHGYRTAHDNATIEEIRVEAMLRNLNRTDASFGEPAFFRKKK